eukprot:TRINITY_DN1205_c0_g1_i4.p1 TRINITY_DN1205_c0_g1~~TRINITY_DN1205_c0_g1_i4.p1  ORF type:complete len:243 (-),score=41.63 TRINITY_DN1205_c0_g1_i4:818-1546(-)
MPEFDSVILVCMYMYVSDERDPRLISTMPVLRKPLILSPSQGIMFPDINATLSFGNTPQDVLTVLGSPQHISYKKSNPLSIHKGREKQESCEYQYDYFYNYFDLGLDVLFDATEHVIKKFVVHTNFPTHPNFNVYQKCHFQLLPPAQDGDQNEKDEGDDLEGEWKDDDDFEIKMITPETKWPEIAESYGNQMTEPFFNPPPKDNPFGGSRYFAHRDIIFEVMDNDFVSSVTLFCSSVPSPFK